MPAFIYFAEVEIGLPSCSSLKDKRSILKGLLERLREKTGCAVSETDFQDKWQRAGIAIVAVSNTSVHSEQVIQSALKLLESDPRISVEAISTERL